MGGVVVGRVGVVAEAEAATGEVGGCNVVVGVDAAAPLPVEELVKEVAAQVTADEPGVFIYRKESVFPIVALANEKWQPAGFATLAKEST